MKNYIILLSVIFMAFCSCSKEEDYYFGITQNNNVNFRAVNLTVGQDSIDYAVSTKYINSFNTWDYRDHYREFSLTWFPKYNGEITNDSYSLTIDLYYKNRLWIGGNNDIEVKFLPSCPEERSAEFTFPNGQKVTLTRENPVYVWKSKIEDLKRLAEVGQYFSNLPIYAISKFEKDGLQYVNSGFIDLYVNNNRFSDMLCYDDTLGIWYMNVD